MARVDVRLKAGVRVAWVPEETKPCYILYRGLVLSATQARVRAKKKKNNTKRS